MAHAKAVPLSLALLAALLVLGSTAPSVDDHSGHGGNLYDLYAVCEHASFPTECQAFIPTLSKQTPASLTEASLKAAMAAGEDALAFAGKLLAAPNTDSVLKKNLEACQASYKSTIENIQRSLEIVEGPPAPEELMNSVSAAVAAVGGCDDAFSEEPDKVSPVADVTTKLEMLVSNSLSLAIGALV